MTPRRQTLAKAVDAAIAAENAAFLADPQAQAQAAADGDRMRRQMAQTNPELLIDGDADAMLCDTTGVYTDEMIVAALCAEGVDEGDAWAVVGARDFPSAPTLSNHPMTDEEQAVARVERRQMRDEYREQGVDLSALHGAMFGDDDEPTGCDAYDADECAMTRERSVAGVSDEIPSCPVHPDPVDEPQDVDLYDDVLAALIGAAMGIDADRLSRDEIDAVEKIARRIADGRDGGRWFLGRMVRR